MAGDSAISEDMRALIGYSGEPVVLEVERGAIKRFCGAVGDDNPLFTDSAHAEKGPHGEIVCPPGFFGWPVKASPPSSPTPNQVVLAEFAKNGFPGLLDGGVDYELLLPIRAGDVLVSSARVADIYEREGRAGKSLFGVFETTYTNQNGDVVARAFATMIGRPA